jgi:DNA-directed RNA polymerase subunit M/transcription elongation factor TFIIS
LLVIVTASDRFYFKCSKCESIEEPDDIDTLLFEEASGTNLVVYKEILLTAGKDPVNPKVEKTCKCGSNRARQVRLGKEMRVINTCVECNEQWLEGTKETD